MSDLTNRGRPEAPDAAAKAEVLEKLLDECEQRYQRLVESCPDMIYRLRVHPDVAFEYINPAGERVLGYPLEQLRAMDKEELFGILADDEERAVAEEIIAGRRVRTEEIRHWRRANGQEAWTEQHATPILDETGRLVALEGIARDVTDRERALHALREVEGREQRLIQSLPDLLLRMDESGTFTEHLPTGSKQPVKVFIGKVIEEVVSELARPAALKALQQARAGTTGSFRCEIDVWGDSRRYEIRLIPDDEGLLALLRDVTDEEWAAAEDERRQTRSELENTVDQLLVIRNPYHLTFREFTVLHLIARGSADKEIATELGIANSTVNKHVSNILGKMGASSRTEAGVRAVQEGLARV